MKYSWVAFNPSEIIKWRQSSRCCDFQISRICLEPTLGIVRIFYNILILWKSTIQSHFVCHSIKLLMLSSLWNLNLNVVWQFERCAVRFSAILPITQDHKYHLVPWGSSIKNLDLLEVWFTGTCQSFLHYVDFHSFMFCLLLSRSPVSLHFSTNMTFLMVKYEKIFQTQNNNIIPNDAWKQFFPEDNGFQKQSYWFWCTKKGGVEYVDVLGGIKWFQSLEAGILLCNDVSMWLYGWLFTQSKMEFVQKEKKKASQQPAIFLVGCRHCVVNLWLIGNRVAHWCTGTERTRRFPGFHKVWHRPGPFFNATMIKILGLKIKEAVGSCAIPGASHARCSASVCVSPGSRAVLRHGARLDGGIPDWDWRTWQTSQLPSWVFNGYRCALLISSFGPERNSVQAVSMTLIQYLTISPSCLHSAYTLL